MAVNASAFLPRPEYRQRVLVKARDRLLTQWDFTAADPGGKREVTVPPEAFEGDRLDLTFDLPDATSPQEQHLSGDPRVLGIALQGFSLDPK